MGEMSRDDLQARLRAVVAEARRSGLTRADVAAALRGVGEDVQRWPGPDAGPDVAEALPARTAKVGPVTLFNEMGALERAGRHGWRVVGSGSAMHIVAPTAEQWEFRRVFASRATGRRLEADRWQRFSSGWFPWGYYQRATGRPAETEPVVGGFVIEP